MGSTLHGCVQSYRCAALTTSPCVDYAPKLSTAAVAFWMVQLGITIRAFMLLPHSQKKGQRVVERRCRLSLADRAAIAAGRPPPSGDLGFKSLRSGGILKHLMWLDAVLAALALAAAAVAAALFPADGPLGVTLFWIRTLHGLASFPYVLFCLPGANTLLTHARRTGYDALGHTVAWCGPVWCEVPLAPTACATEGASDQQTAEGRSGTPTRPDPVARRLFPSSWTSRPY